MNRKWILLVAALLTLVVVTGCGKKKKVADTPQPMAEAPEPETRPTPTPAPEDPVEKPQPMTLAERQAKYADEGLLGDVFFEYDQSDLTADARARLAKNAEFMNSHEASDVSFTVEGHCDERGTNEYNLALGDRRAQAARDYLVSLDVASDRIKTISFGEERPFCTQSDEACWQQNRRAHFVLR